MRAQPAKKGTLPRRDRVKDKGTKLPKPPKPTHVKFATRDGASVSFWSSGTRKRKPKKERGEEDDYNPPF